MRNLYYKMKQKFVNSWVESVQPRKQRKYRYNAPLHTRHKFLSANLSKELRKKYGMRNIPLRKGDEVIVMRGKFAKKKGKILDVKLKRSKVTVEGINRKKTDGTKVNVYLDPSILQIISANADDSKRSKKMKVEKKIEKKEIAEKKVTTTKENKDVSEKK